MMGLLGKPGLQNGGSPRQPSPRWRIPANPLQDGGLSRHFHCGLQVTTRKLKFSTQELPNWELSITGFSHPMTSIPYLIWTQAYVLPQPDKRTLPTPSQRDLHDSHSLFLFSLVSRGTSPEGACNKAHLSDPLALWPPSLPPLAGATLHLVPKPGRRLRPRSRRGLSPLATGPLTEPSASKRRGRCLIPSPVQAVLPEAAAGPGHLDICTPVFTAAYLQ